jgi:hypothetical protein
MLKNLIPCTLFMETTNHQLDNSSLTPEEKKRKFIVSRLNGEVDCLATYNFFSQMIKRYHGGSTYKQLAQDYHVALVLGIEGKCKDSLVMAEAIVGEAIRRHDPRPEKRKKISQTRSLDNLTGGHGCYFSELASKGKKDLERLEEISQKGVLKRGRKPLSLEEKERIKSYSQNPLYQTKKGINAREIARQINNDFHEDEPIRTESSIRSYLYHVRSKNGDIPNQ